MNQNHLLPNGIATDHAGYIVSLRAAAGRWAALPGGQDQAGRVQAYADALEVNCSVCAKP